MKFVEVPCTSLLSNQELFSLLILVLLLISLNLIIILGPQRLVDFTNFFPMDDSVKLIPYILFEKYQTINLNDAIFKKND